MRTFKRKTFALLLCLVLLPLPHAFSETTLSLGGSDKSSAEYQMFITAHPELTVNTETNIYLSTNEIISAFLTGEFPFDTFAMTSSSFDIKQMISKGYCAPLTGSTLLSAELQKMYEPVQSLLTQNEDIFGAPFYCYVGYYVYSPEAWEKAGLSPQEVPTSFEEYLDFLEAWVDRISDQPEDEISVCNMFDPEQYGEHSYIGYLVERLINNHIMQCNYANEPIRFDTPLFRNLLERCQRIGEDLYTYEPVQKGEFGLFDDFHGMRQLAYLVPLRLTVDQPILIKATLHTAFLNVRSEHKELATEYLENCVTCMLPEVGAYLYRDAQPVEDPGYMRSMETVENEIQALEKKLENTALEPLERNTLETQLQEKQLEWEAMAVSEQRYLISENDLNLYRNYGENLYFQAPSIFDPSTKDGQNIKQLQDRFSKGGLSADQFIARLDELAWLLEQEKSV